MPNPIASFDNLEELIQKAINIRAGKDRFIEKWGTHGELAEVNPRAIVLDEIASTVRNKRSKEFSTWDSAETVALGSRHRKVDTSRHDRAKAKIAKHKEQLRADIDLLIAEHLMYLYHWYGELGKFTHAHTQWVLGQPDHYDNQATKLEKGIRLAYIRQINKPHTFRDIDDISVYFEWEKHLIPDIPGCYLIASGTEWLYVGRSRTLRSRIKGHEVVRKYYRQNEDIPYSIVYVIIPTDESASLEKDLIAIFQPKENQSGK